MTIELCVCNKRVDLNFQQVQVMATITSLGVFIRIPNGTSRFCMNGFNMNVFLNPTYSWCNKVLGNQPLRIQCGFLPFQYATYLKIILKKIREHGLVYILASKVTGVILYDIKYRRNNSYWFAGNMLHYLLLLSFDILELISAQNEILGYINFLHHCRAF